MITVDGKPVAIAGIMGGDNSKIEADTKGILIEAAIFDHVSVRNTSRRLNLNTDASIRYQKGIEPDAAVCGDGAAPCSCSSNMRMPKASSRQHIPRRGKWSSAPLR